MKGRKPAKGGGRAGSPPRAEGRVRERRDSDGKLHIPANSKGTAWGENKQQKKEHISATTKNCQEVK